MSAEEIQFEAEEQMSNAVDYLKTELRGIRTGRASTALVERIKVDYYGAPTELRQMANLSTPEPNLIVIKPFDQTATKNIERAIMASDLGVTPNSDGKIIRLTLPSLSGERRKALSSQVRQLAEQSKVSIRNTRRDANKKLDQEEKDGLIPEDDADRAKEDIQELTKDYEKKTDQVLDSKIKEIDEI
jgi:ribosome recycling factor